MKDWITLIESVRARWSRERARPEGRTGPVALDRPTAHVPAEYLSLYTYLDRRYASSVVLTFEQMEALLGFALPVPASVDRDWWTGAPRRTDRHSDAWTEARRTARPNLPARTVTFERLP